MRNSLVRLLATLILALPITTPAFATATSGGINWRAAANDADIARAFAQAKTESKPVLLYWGASWCPPCNKLKATLFTRQDFIAQSRAIVAVNIDGDLPSAQKLGTRFKVTGYPTMILMNANGTEITRLPGEVESAQIINALNLALTGGRPAKALLDDVRANKPLSENEWRTLAYYSWETDEAQLVSADARPQLFADLATASQQAKAEVAARLWLKAVAASDGKSTVKSLGTMESRRKTLSELLANPSKVHQHLDMLVNYAGDLVRQTSEANSTERAALVVAYNAALLGLQNDAALARADQVDALAARIELARIDQAETTIQVSLPEALQRELREASAKLDRDISNGYERQAVIPTVAFVLGRAGLWQESDDLLKTSLAKSISPYYLMSSLGSNAKKQGRNDEALVWYGKAWNASVGPATRLQWGATYVMALIDMAPDDAARISATATQIFTEAGKDGSAFHQRSARSLARIADKLATWNTADAHQAELTKITAQIDGLCKRLPAKDPQKASCAEVLAKASKT
ncbi:MAG: thioredoxin family protein [Rhodocyclaceae bacterium]|nr:thioredoxin family protein [Rhodocyclaceae bacterium]MBP6278760.1 thioredoxin family protein [Rhodocyclaceae bacterium]